MRAEAGAGLEDLGPSGPELCSGERTSTTPRESAARQEACTQLPAPLSTGSAPAQPHPCISMGAGVCSEQCFLQPWCPLNQGH